MIADILNTVQLWWRVPFTAAELGYFQSLNEIGQSAPVIIHDIANPLTTATSALEMVLRDAETGLEYNPSSRQELEVSLECLQHIQAMLKQHRILLDQHSSHVDTFFVRQEIQSVLHLYKAQSQRKTLCIQLGVPRQLQWSGNAVRFRQLIGNLLSNAFDTPGVSRINIQVQEQSSFLLIKMQDNGPGIPTHLVPYIFHPFFSTKPRGTGLGLSIVKNIVEKEFGGKVSVVSQNGKGTTFLVTLPKKK